MTDGSSASGAEWDVVVIGAGIAGASAAYELSHALRVLILEREPHVGYHATGRSEAVFIEPYGNEVVQALTAASKAFFFDPPPGFLQPVMREIYRVLFSVEEEGLILPGGNEPGPAPVEIPFFASNEVEASMEAIRRRRSSR